MTAAQRQQVRNAIDQAARQRRQALLDQGRVHVCAGCGRDIDMPGATQGCTQCHGRTRGVQRRADPNYLAQERARQQRERATRVQRERERQQRKRATA